MNKTNYKECYRMTDVDNAFMEYYNKAYCDDKNTKQDDAKHYDLGYNYTDNSDFYYEYDRDEEHWYVVVN